MYRGHFDLNHSLTELSCVIQPGHTNVLRSVRKHASTTYVINIYCTFKRTALLWSTSSSCILSLPPSLSLSLSLYICALPNLTPVCCHIPLNCVHSLNGPACSCLVLKLLLSPRAVCRCIIAFQSTNEVELDLKVKCCHSHSLSPPSTLRQRSSRQPSAFLSRACLISSLHQTHDHSDWYCAF